MSRRERAHYDRHGKTKETYLTFEKAQEQADYLNKWKRRQWHYPSEAYECWICGLYHVGSRRFGTIMSRRQVFMLEIGERAYRELIFENRQGRRGKKRGYNRIVGRYYKGQPELLKQLYMDKVEV